MNGTAAEHDEVADKVRALAQAGNKTGEIVRLLQQNHVTAELVHKLCPELDP